MTIIDHRRKRLERLRSSAIVRRKDSTVLWTGTEDADVGARGEDLLDFARQWKLRPEAAKACDKSSPSDSPSAGNHVFETDAP
jgi:hypothetical protein